MSPGVHFIRNGESVSFLGTPEQTLDGVVEPEGGNPGGHGHWRPLVDGVDHHLTPGPDEPGQRGGGPPGVCDVLGNHSQGREVEAVWAAELFDRGPDALVKEG